MSSSLAVAYRPRRFADVAGQAHIRAALTSSIRTGNIPHQLLLAGGSGLGKTTMARLFAAALFCPQRTGDGDACGSCESCLQVTGPGSTHPDVIELDAASYGGKDDIRDIAAKAALLPMRASHKLYIIDEAHGLSGAGAQAFLRLLEEPPAHVIFALATTDAHKLPSALRGRCLQLEVLPLTNDDLLANLARVAVGRGWVLPTSCAQACIDATDPALGVRGTVMSLEKIAPLLSDAHAPDESLVGAILGVATHTSLASISDAVIAGNPGAALIALDAATSSGSARGVHDQLVRWARARLLAAARAGQGTATAFDAFELLVTCGTHPGALEVAVVQAAGVPVPRAGVTTTAPPGPAASPGAAHTAVAGRPVASPVAARTAPTQAPHVAAARPTQAQPGPAPRAGARPGERRELLALPDPRLVALLNALSKVAPAAAAVVRRGQVFAQGGSLSISLGPDLHPRAQRAGLGPALEALRAASVVDACWENQ